METRLMIMKDKKQETPLRPVEQSAFIKRTVGLIGAVMDGSLPMPDARAEINKLWSAIDEDKRTEIAQGVLDDIQKIKHVADGLYVEMQQATLKDRP